MKKYLFAFTFFAIFAGLNSLFYTKVKADSVTSSTAPTSIQEVYHDNINPNQSVFFDSTAPKEAKKITKSIIIPIFKKRDTRSTLVVGNCVIRYTVFSHQHYINQALSMSATAPLDVQGNFIINGRLGKGLREIDSMGFDISTETKRPVGYYATYFKGMVIPADPDEHMSIPDINLFGAVTVH